MAPKKTTKKVAGEVEETNVDSTEETTEETEATTEASAEVEVDAVDVIRGEIYVRQYSREVHGEDFIKLAEQFCSKKSRLNEDGSSKFSVVPAHTIKSVEVRYREKEDAELHLDKQNPDAPMVDKIKVFENKDEAIAFSHTKFGSTAVISKKKQK